VAKKPTKRYWVDWENAATRVGESGPDDGWSLGEEPPQRRFTQRGYESPDAAPEAAAMGDDTGATREPAPPRPPAAQPSARPPTARPAAPRAPTGQPAAAAPPARARRLSPFPSHSEEAAAQAPVAAAGELENRTTRPRPQQPPPPEVEPVMDGRTAIVARAAPPAEPAKVELAGPPAGLVRADNPPDVAVATHNFPAELATDPRLILMRAPDSPQAAAYRVLRHHVVQQGNPQVIVVASPRPGEGKTTCAVNLALAFAECRRSRVLLCDANFRRPQLSTVFRFKPPWCFAEQLIEHRDRPLSQWSVVEVSPFGLHVIAANTRPEPVRDAPAFAFAIERLRAAGYDYIIIDAPAVLGAAEVNLLQDAADGVLLVSRAGSSRRAELRSSIEQLAPAPILGVALLEG
jgi:Mrp family chromosome partitioning ATPase